MSVFANLAKLQTLMPFDAITEAVGMECRPSAGGWIAIDSQVYAHIDLSGRIGRLEFHDGFPATISVAGYCIGMTLDEVMAADMRFKMLPWTPFNGATYTIQETQGDNILVRVNHMGLVEKITIERPGLLYPDGSCLEMSWLDASKVDMPSSAHSDATEMLWEWAARKTFKSDYLSYFGYAKWLSEEATPDDWHQAVLAWNWGDGLEPLHWIIRQPNCDKATALTAFYMARPGQTLDDHGDRTQVSGRQLESFDLIDEIRRRFLDRFYTRSEFYFDGESAVKNEAYLPGHFDEEQFDRAIPKVMRMTLPGREAKGGESDGWDRTAIDTRRPSKLVPPLPSPEKHHP